MSRNHVATHPGSAFVLVCLTACTAALPTVAGAPAAARRPGARGDGLPPAAPTLASLDPADLDAFVAATVEAQQRRRRHGRRHAERRR